MEVCKTDMQKIIKYLDDAAIMYDNHPGQRNVCRAWAVSYTHLTLPTKA